MEEPGAIRYALNGVCVWLTGLSGAGKTTTAVELAERLAGFGRIVTVLDGDVVRQHLSKGLGFSREDRDTNVRRIAWVASEIVRHGGVVLVAAISPYRETRAEARQLIGGERFVEVFVDTPLEVCEQRDAKGLYARARRHDIDGLTGVDDPYERPEAPDVTLETLEHTPAANAEEVLSLLRRRGFLATRSHTGP